MEIMLTIIYRGWTSLIILTLEHCLLDFPVAGEGESH